MEDVPNNKLLQLSKDIVRNLRKIHNLEEPRMSQTVDLIQEWIKKQEHLMKKDYSPEYLERVLISCKGSIEKAKKQIDMLATFKTLLPHFFCIYNVKEEYADLKDLFYLAPLPKMTDDYYRIFFVKVHIQNIKPEYFLKYYQLVIIIAEYIKRYDYFNGFGVIYDLRDSNLFDIVTKINSTLLQQFMSIIIEGLGGRIKFLNILSDSKAVDVLVKTLKQFLPNKISQRINVVLTLEDLQEIVPKSILPTDYGGEGKSVKNISEDWLEEMSSPEHQRYMKMMSRAGTDESLRSESKFNEEYMGMPGSFRNLIVD